MFDLLDGIAKSYAVVEPIWATTAAGWEPVSYTWRDPRFFRFDRETGSQIRLKTPNAIEGEPLPRYRYAVHIPKLKSGLPFRGGLAWVAVWHFMLKSFDLRDWMVFLETYGVPMRVGKYNPSATRDERLALLRAVRDIAGDAAAIIPDTMMLELLEAKAGGGTDAHERLARFLDEQTSKLVIGQTMTSDGGSSLAQAQVHERVRMDIRRTDARDVAVTIQGAIIEPYVTFNFGLQAAYPQLTLPVEEPEDLESLIKYTRGFVDMGGKVSMSKLRDRLALEDPEEGEELLTVSPAKVEVPTNRANARYHHHYACCSDLGHATASVALDADRELADLEAEALRDWERVVDPMLGPLRRAVAAADSFEALIAALPGLVGDIDGSRMMDRLAIETTKARALGDAVD